MTRPHASNQPEYLMGRRAGKRGLPRTCPYGPKSTSALAWLAGYDVGVAEAIGQAGETSNHDLTATPTRNDKTQTY